VLLGALGQCVDGEFQKFTVESGAYIREKLVQHDPRVSDVLREVSDEQLRQLRRGGHDPAKVFAAYQAAVDNVGSPTVILAKTFKGFGMGESGEGRNITHQQKKMKEDELREFRARFGIPVPDDRVMFAPFYRPPEDSRSLQYLRARREALGGSLPRRMARATPLSAPPTTLFEEFHSGNERPVSTTMAFVKILSKLLRDPELGPLVVPIVPDEARTFGMDGLFRQIGIYSSAGQVYEPVDSEALLYYKEAKDGQLLEEGINEAGAMCSFLAAGTAYASHGVNTIPFFVYYSMFGFQRIGDLIWAGGDLRCKGFLVGGTAGRTTLAGEGLQHQDGHSHLWASAIPTLRCYDPAYAYEMAVIIRDGIHRMYELQEDGFYYMTVGNENYAMPPMPSGNAVEEGILKGLYQCRPGRLAPEAPQVHLLGSGAILNEAVKAQQILEEQYQVAADVWSATSFKELRLDGLEAERWNLLHPGEPSRIPYVTQCLGKGARPVVAASDYVKALPDGIGKWVPGGLTSLGTDGFGRSESREALRDFFEVDARYIVLAALHALAKLGEWPLENVRRAMDDLGIDPGKKDPLTF